MKFLTYFILAALLLFSLTAYGVCPDCYRNQIPLEPLRGYAADGRRRINVAIKARCYS